jgi:hypothetical protein
MCRFVRSGTLGPVQPGQTIVTAPRTKLSSDAMAAPTVGAIEASPKCKRAQPAPATDAIVGPATAVAVLDET